MSNVFSYPDPSSPKKDVCYLGDGAYAEFDGHSVRVYCSREGGVHEVFLEPDGILSLVRAMERWYKMNIKITPMNPVKEEV